MSFDDRLNGLIDMASSLSEVDASNEFQKSTFINSFHTLLSDISTETKSYKYDKGLLMLSKVLKITCQIETLRCFEGVICRRIGCILHQQNKLDQAIRMYFRNVEVSRKIEDSIGESDAYGDIALCLYALKKYKDSVLIYNMQVELNMKSNDELILYLAKSNLGLALTKLGRLNEAEDTLKLCVEYFKSKEDIYNLANSYARLAHCYHISGKWRRAKMTYNLCLDACICFGDPLLIAMARLDFALCLHNEGKCREAIEEFGKAEKILTSSRQITPLIAVVYSYAARSAFMMKDFSLAINRANLAIDHFNMSRSKITPQEGEATFEEEREAYTWLCLSQIFCRKLIDALVSTEKCRQLVFEKSIKRVVRNSITHSICNRKSVIRALRQINSPIFMFQMIRLSSTITYLILWLILPTTKTSRIKIICKPTVFSSHGIIDVRQWVSHCRLKLGFKGWQWNDESTRVNAFPMTYDATVLNPLLHSLSYEDLRRLPAPYVPKAKDEEGKESATTKTSELNKRILSLVGMIGSMIIVPASIVFVRITAIISFLLDLIYYINGLPPVKSVSDKIMSKTRMSELSETIPKEVFDTLGSKSFDDPPVSEVCRSSGIDSNIQGGDEIKESLVADNDNRFELVNSEINMEGGDVTSSTIRNIGGSISSSKEERSHIVRNLVSKYKNRRNRARRRLTQATLICRELYEVFFMPFEHFMAQFTDGQQLLIVSHDVLSLLPYSAMLDSDGNYMVEKYKIKLLSSISLTSRLMERERDKFIWRNDLSTAASTSAVTVSKSVNVRQQRTFQLTRSPYLAGKSIFSFFPKLCQVDREIDRIKDLFMEQKILCSVVDDRGPTKQDIAYALRHSSIFHLATHGTRNGYLILSGDETDDPDTFLTITDIYDLYNKKGELTPDLVILNACLAVTDSVLMDNMDSYVMALLSCGSSCVITTIGDIEDVGAEEIMVHFYSSLLGTAESDICSKSTPLDCVEALQAATLKLMTTADYQDKPNLWATYIAVGLGVDLRGPIF